MSISTFRARRSDEFVTDNPILDAGEIGYERDTKKAKLGNGSETYAALSYLGSGAGSSGGIASGRTVTASTSLILADAGTRITAAHATVPIVLTIPADVNAAWPNETVVIAYQALAAGVSFVGAAGVTVHSLDTSVQYGLLTALRTGSNEWTVQK